MIKLYTNTNLLTEENRSFVFPLLFDLCFLKSDFLIKYYKIVTDINECDVVVLPLEYTYSLKNYKLEKQTLFDKAKEFNKRVWVYSGGDFGYSLKDEKVFNFRLSGFKSKLNTNTIIIPSFINDPYESNLKKDFKVLKKEVFPKIGFVGHAKGNIVKYLKEFSVFIKINVKRVFRKELKDYQPFYPSSVKRAKYLRLLKMSKEIETNFILRDKYRAGAKTQKEKQITTEEFYQNIYNNPYTFCIRGAGNFSVRFYETLAVGRIPVLLDTDCRLPLHNKIKWSNHCLIIDENRRENIREEVLNFHKNINEDSFIKLQESNRLLWKQILKRDSFFKEIHDVFINKFKLNESL
ncbi:hypothetical protein [Flavivirga spongiicola]|uniref:Glycosyltransferase family 47 protein n=1 Tax=Flavivirga spongiicola TaxID=421621 RepID=A0ABU7XMM2_9FLAO|nr:hypothetical protein [Flavivirga sp. MEBiC05379]MDO5981676.1 hypothetical protein [Flavivirga sp. MEBiC05379]